MEIYVPEPDNSLDHILPTGALNVMVLSDKRVFLQVICGKYVYVPEAFVEVDKENGQGSVYINKTMRRHPVNPICTGCVLGQNFGEISSKELRNRFPLGV